RAAVAPGHRPGGRDRGRARGARRDGGQTVRCDRAGRVLRRGVPGASDHEGLLPRSDRSPRARWAAAAQRRRRRGATLPHGAGAGRRLRSAQARGLEDAAAEAGLSGVWTLTHASLLTTPADGNMVFVVGGALSSPEVAKWREAWVRAGPHPGAVLDPTETGA